METAGKKNNDTRKKLKRLLLHLLLEDRIETLVTDDLLENKPRLEKNSYYLTEKSNQLLLIVYD